MGRPVIIAYPELLANVNIKAKVSKEIISVDYRGYYNTSAIATPINLTFDVQSGWVTDIKPRVNLQKIADALISSLDIDARINDDNILCLDNLKCAVSDQAPAQILGKSASNIFPKDKLFHEIQMVMHRVDEGANSLWLWGRGEHKVDRVVWHWPTNYQKCILLDAVVRPYLLYPFF